MKLDYCQKHRGAPVEDAAMPCLAIRHDDGRRVTQRELWAEIERLRAALLKVLDTSAPTAGHDETPSSDTERADAALQTAYAEGRKDERADWLPLLQAIQPLIEFNSSDEFITIRVRTADIAKARAAASYVKGS